jgi:hypothetical protein
MYSRPAWSRKPFSLITILVKRLALVETLESRNELERGNSGELRLSSVARWAIRLGDIFTARALAFTDSHHESMLVSYKKCRIPTGDGQCPR